jgi:GNAT superfamily N-acetyltransferase
MLETEPFIIQKSSPDSPTARPLIQALSSALFQITGNDGTASFADQDVQHERAVFLVAFDDDEAVGCGGLRPLSETVGEIKRMYAKYAGRGIGSVILQALEQHAVELGYQKIWLETRKVNTTAVAFYIRHNYQIRLNYGKYVGRSEAVCFEKLLIYH